MGLRPDSRKIGVLITDGKSQDDIIGNSQSLKDTGIELYAIGEPSTSTPFVISFFCLRHTYIHTYILTEE